MPKDRQFTEKHTQVLGYTVSLLKGSSELRPFELYVEGTRSDTVPSFTDLLEANMVFATVIELLELGLKPQNALEEAQSLHQKGATVSSFPTPVLVPASSR